MCRADKGRWCKLRARENKTHMAWDDDGGNQSRRRHGDRDDNRDADDDKFKFAGWNPATPSAFMRVFLIPDDLFSEVMLPGLERTLEIDTQRNHNLPRNAPRRSSASSDADVYAESIFRAIHSHSEASPSAHDPFSVGSRAVFGQRVSPVRGASPGENEAKTQEGPSTAVLVESIVLAVFDTSMTIQLRGVSRLRVERELGRESSLDGVKDAGIPASQATSMQPQPVLARVFEDEAVRSFEQRLELAEAEWSVWTLAKKLVELDMRIKRAELGLKSSSDGSGLAKGREQKFAQNQSLLAGLSGYPDMVDFPVSAYFLPPMVHALAPKDYDRVIERNEWEQTPVGIRKMWQDRACRFSFAVLDMYQQSERSGLNSRRSDTTPLTRAQSMQGVGLQQDIYELVTTVDTCARFAAMEKRLRVREAEQTAKLAVLTAFISDGSDDATD
ncbi:hypothetical protein FVE85_6362 [Porphyridium purpureum]|uniref:Uncharacterized protein n=1 Tax=Porphyridium purpureum TaxID=35688 RepID=A0A5J4Z7W1_PORPP|nr:hypothetical protein FVE85_6362 [Porphyridium purpureum]|eukprot:POR2231..scf295_1